MDKRNALDRLMGLLRMLCTGIKAPIVGLLTDLLYIKNTGKGSILFDYYLMVNRHLFYSGRPRDVNLRRLPSYEPRTWLSNPWAVFLKFEYFGQLSVTQASNSMVKTVNPSGRRQTWLNAKLVLVDPV